MSALEGLPPQLLPSAFTVETLDSLHTLRCVSDCVHGLTLKQEWCVWPPSPTERAARQPLPPLRSFDLSHLSPSVFSHLVDMEISLLARHSLDLNEIHDCAPHLERLCLRETAMTRNMHVLSKFRDLRVLELRPRRDGDTGAGRVDRNFEDLVGIPKLEELYIDNGISCERIRNAHLLAHIRPLRVLWVCAEWDERPSDDALRVHLSTLRELRLPYQDTWSMSVLANGTHLRVLKASIGFDSDSDVTSQRRRFQALPLCTLTDALMSQGGLALLPTLASLKDLTISVPSDAHDCRALRGFTNLRTHGLRSGWTRDFIAYLPKLRVLKCTDYAERLFLEPEDPLDGFVSPVRRAIIDGYAVLAPFALTVLQQVEELAILFNAPKNFLPHAVAAHERQAALCRAPRIVSTLSVRLGGLLRQP